MTIEIQHLVKRYGDAFTLSVPALRIERSTSFGLVGNNGAGKTTFLRCLLDLIAPDEGQVRIDGQPVADTTDWKARTGAYLDASFLIDFLTADEYFAFTGDVHGLSSREIEIALDPYRSFYTDESLGKTTKYLRDLSRGNQQKAGLIGAMFIQPELLILDEPFANLDPRSQIQLKKLLHRLNREQDTTMIISSHDLSHVTEVCDRVAVLEDGQIARDESTTTHTLDTLTRYFAANVRTANA